MICNFISERPNAGLFLALWLLLGGFLFYASFSSLSDRRKEFEITMNYFVKELLRKRKVCDWIIANWLEAKTIIFRYFLARYRNFLPQVDQKVHQVPQNLPQAFCIGDVRRYDIIKPEKKLYNLKHVKLLLNYIFLKTYSRNNHF